MTTLVFSTLETQANRGSRIRSKSASAALPRKQRCAIQKTDAHDTQPGQRD